MAKHEVVKENEQVRGILGTAEEKTDEFAKAYAQALKDDNGEAIAALIKAAGKAKRVLDRARKLEKNPEAFAIKLHEAQNNLKAANPEADAKKEIIIDTLAKKTSALRRVTGWRKFAESVENF